jgi:hypothetical protein
MDPDGGDNARADYQAGRLPDSTRPAFNALVKTYSVARESWLTYRGGIATNQPATGYFNQFNCNLLDLGRRSTRLPIWRPNEH